MSGIQPVSTASPLHEPLPNALTHIRLLEVLQGKVGQHVVCAMSVWPLDTAPPYDAISYTWGDPTLTVPVTINGQELIVRRNCAYVMQQWFTTRTSVSRYIWVDAICIDQSNLKERGSQVTIMGELYRKASHVLACVGPHADDSEYLFAFCRKETILLGQLHSRTPTNFSEDIWSKQWSRRIKQIFNSSAMEIHPINGVFIGPRTKTRLRLACIAFMKRAYFSRVWILQELYMGTNVSYVCGEDVTASELMLAVTLLADPAFEEELKAEYPLMTAGVQKISNFTSGLFGKTERQDVVGATYDDIQPYLGCLGLAAESREAFKLEGVLRFIHHFECMDKRDRLYGTLALVQWRTPWGRKQAIARPTPDYEKNPFLVAAEVFSMVNPGGVHDVGYALSWVQQLFKIFDLDPLDATVREAIAKRYTTRLGVDAKGGDGVLHDHTKDQCWHSMRICDSSSPEAREPYNLHCAESADGGQLVTLLDHDNIPFAQAPPQTCVGDFYTEMHLGCITPESWSTLGIIVKGPPKAHHAPHNLSLLGLARRLPSQACVSARMWDLAMGEKFRSVELFWHVDDVFLLYISTLVQSDLPTEYLVRLRICDPEREDSSFARLSWSADKPYGVV